MKQDLIYFYEGKPIAYDKNKYCLWTFTMDFEAGIWDTSCGEAWEMFEGGKPIENGYKFCPTCGKAIVEYVPSKDEEEEVEEE